MKKWDTLYQGTMKSNNEVVRKYIRRAIREFLFEAEEENPFGTPEEEKADEEGAEEAGGEEPAADEEGEEDTKEPAKKGTAEPAGIPVTFDATAVKKYNDLGFKSDTGTLKKIDKKGLIVTTQPDGVDVFVNFDDISENVKNFFKKKK